MAPRDQFRYSSLSLRRGPERNERRRSGPGSEGVDDFRIGWACGCHLRPSLQYRVDEVLLKREPYHANAVRPRLQHVDPWDVRGRDRHLREDQFHGNPAPHRGNLYAIPTPPSMIEHAAVPQWAVRPRPRRGEPRLFDGALLRIQVQPIGD